MRGDAWLSRPGHPALPMVPSAVVPGVTNMLFDPRHADAAQVIVSSITPFVFDARLDEQLSAMCAFQLRVQMNHLHRVAEMQNGHTAVVCPFAKPRDPQAYFAPDAFATAAPRSV